jgi:hypothetical protein
VKIDKISEVVAAELRRNTAAAATDAKAVRDWGAASRAYHAAALGQGPDVGDIDLDQLATRNVTLDSLIAIKLQVSFASSRFWESHYLPAAKGEPHPDNHFAECSAAYGGVVASPADYYARIFRPTDQDIKESLSMSASHIEGISIDGDQPRNSGTASKHQGWTHSGLMILCLVTGIGAAAAILIRLL